MDKTRLLTNKFFQVQSQWLFRIALVAMVLLVMDLVILGVMIIIVGGDTGENQRALFLLCLVIGGGLLVAAVIMLAYITYIAWLFYQGNIVGMALRDALTGCFNRHYFNEFLIEQKRLYHRYGHDFVVAMIDIDHFKLINDRMGHDIGDLVLKELTQHIKKNIRSSDVLGRMGGEEFVILFPGLGIQEGEKVAGELLGSIDEKSDFSCGHMTVSMGLASMSQMKDNSEDLMKKADISLYQAKEGGRNRLQVYQQTSHIEA